MGFTCSKVQPEEFLPHLLPEEGVEDASGKAANSPSGEVDASGDQFRADQAKWPPNVQSRYDLEIYCITLNRSRLDLALQPPELKGSDASQALPY